MSDRERFNRQMHYQSVDRCFNMEFGFWQENYDQWPLFVDNGIKHEGQANQFFNFDRLSSVDIHSWLHPAFERKVLSETATHQTIQNHDGLWAEIPKDDHSTIPHYTKASLVTPDDWRKVKEEKMRLDDPARVIASPIGVRSQDSRFSWRGGSVVVVLNAAVFLLTTVTRRIF